MAGDVFCDSFSRCFKGDFFFFFFPFCQILAKICSCFSVFFHGGVFDVYTGVSEQWAVSLRDEDSGHTSS